MAPGSASPHPHRGRWCRPRGRRGRSGRCASCRRAGCSAASSACKGELLEEGGPDPTQLVGPHPRGCAPFPICILPMERPHTLSEHGGGGSAPALLALCSLHIKIHQQRLMGKIGNGGPGMVGMQLSHPSRLVPCALLESMNYLGRACGEAAGAGRGEDEASIIPL